MRIERHSGCFGVRTRFSCVAAPREAAGEARWTGQASLTINRRSRPLAPGSAQVAQLVEHATENRSVGGSIPPLGTIKSFRLLINSIIQYSALFGDDRLQPHCIRKPDLAISSVSSSRLHKARSSALGPGTGHVDAPLRCSELLMVTVASSRPFKESRAALANVVR